ncbi:thiamine transporter 1-like isoform X2 [Pseudoliparis swirei]|uniref:thiamine transporter 1-like isoform X2 n=1 Tax=Pseudoliparis swirei TaxID=2059687 RepID=UPI0024BDED2F|nr:thiamine transporter 1-like isoform X2 [Pseudoliparis swirei]
MEVLRSWRADWRFPTALLCIYGFLSTVKPMEPFLIMYMTGPDKNLTIEQVNNTIFPVWTYSYLAVLVPVFLLTDWLRYKPVVMLQAASLLVTTAMLLWLRSVAAMQAMQAFYGVATASEVAYYSYIYSVVPLQHYRGATSCVRGAALLGLTVGSALGQLLVSFRLLSLDDIMLLPLGCTAAALLAAGLLPAPRSSLFFHRRQGGPGRTTRDQQVGEPERTTRDQQVGEPERTTRDQQVGEPERTTRDQQVGEPERTTRDQQVGEPERTTRDQQVGEPERTTRDQQVGEPERTTRDQQVGEPERTTRDQQVGEPERTTRDQQVGEPERTTRDQQVGEPERTTRDQQVGEPERTTRDQQVGEPERTTRDQQVGEPEKTTRDQQVGESQDGGGSRPQVLLRLWRDVCRCYSSRRLLSWSVWWAAASCGYNQTANYVQVLWEHVQPAQNASVYHGGVEAVSNLLAAYGIGFSAVRWERWGELAVGGCSGLQAAALFLMTFSGSIWLCYAGYVAFKCLHLLLITIATFQVAADLSMERYALVFGVNTFGALVLQTIITSVVVDRGGLGLGIIAQFTINAGFFSVIAVVYSLLGMLMLWRRQRSNEAPESISPVRTSRF